MEAEIKLGWRDNREYLSMVKGVYFCFLISSFFLLCNLVT